MNSMTLTDIKKTKRGSYALFFDGEFQFSVNDDVLISYNLSKDMKVDDCLFCELRRKSDIGRAKNKAYRYLSVRAHSREELKKKLEREFDALTSESAVEDIEKLGYVDDYSYAKSCFDYVITRKKMSCRQAENYLANKGIDREIISEILCDYKNSERAVLDEIIENKYMDKLNKKDYNKVFTSLVRKGFSPKDISDALQTFIEEDDDRYDY
ncbi:MAG: hypothetical protein GX928_03490 [Ruminococcaceae bacterium]|nr:hypothetical protein [Oscillospiraceae bacterium]